MILNKRSVYNIKNINVAYITIYSILYFLSFAPMFFITEIFFDSCAALPGIPEVYDRFWQAGRPYVGPITDFIALLDKPLNGVLSAGRIIVFFSYYLSGIFLFFALYNFGLFSSRDAFWIALLSIMSPMNNTRIIQTIMIYNLSVLTFCCGLFFLEKHLKTKKISLRILSLLFFLFSFMTESFIAMYVLAALLIYFYFRELLLLKLNLLRLLRIFFHTFIKYLDFHILPILYIAIRYFYFLPSGIKRGDKSVNIEKLINAFSLLPRMLYEGVFNLYFVTKSSQHMHPNSIIFIASICIILIVSFFSGMELFKHYNGKKRFSFVKSFFEVIFKIIGVWMLLCLALYTYAVYGPQIHYLPWDSRSQTALIPVIGIFIVVILRAVFFKKTISDILMIVIVSWFVSINFTVYSSFLKDSHSQTAIIAQLSETPELKRYNNYMASFDLTGRPGPPFIKTYYNYEFTYWLYKAFGTDSRLGVGGGKEPSNWRDFTQMYIGWFRKLKGYNFSSYKQDKRIFLIRVDPGNESLTVKKAIYLSLKRLINNNAYMEDVKNLVRLSVYETDWDTWDGTGYGYFKQIEK